VTQNMIQHGAADRNHRPLLHLSRLGADEIPRPAALRLLNRHEDMHLKNWSLITRDDKVELSPAYDLLNSTIPNSRSREELALPLRGKKSELRANDFWRYLAGERLVISAALIEQTKARFAEACARWPARIESSFLSPEMKTRYLTLFEDRRQRLSL